MPHHRLISALGLAAGLAAAGPAAAQKHSHDHGAQAAHQHGLASLQVVAEDRGLTVTLDSPLDNLLGFERAPRTDRERQAVRAVAQRLHANAGLVVPTAAAGCTLRGVALASAVIDPALLAPAGQAAAAAAPAKPPAPAAGEHADMEAIFSFDCAQPAALKGVAVGGLFQAFTRLRQLDAAVVAPGVQRGFKLDGKRSALGW